MRALLLALCLAAGAVLVPAAASAADPGSTQSTSQTQVTAVDNTGAQSAGLVSGPIVVPVQTGLGLNLSDLLTHFNIL